MATEREWKAHLRRLDQELLLWDEVHGSDKEATMGEFFNNKEDALVWLVVNKWRQNHDGVWLKGKRRAELRPSPADDGVVCLVFVRDVETTREEHEAGSFSNPVPYSDEAFKASFKATREEF